MVHLTHSHNFLGDSHADKEWRTWSVIVLCSAAMIVEIVCGILFGSLALVADGIHMSTHAVAFFITAMAYSYSRIHANDDKFVFGTGKIGELSSFTCALILLAVAAVIVYEGVYELIYPVQLDFIPALIVSFVGLAINVASGALLMASCGDGAMDHAHGHGHGHSHAHGGDESEFTHAFDLEEGLGAEDCEGHGHDHGHGDGHVDGHDHCHGHEHGHEEHQGHDHGHRHSHDAETYQVELSGRRLELSLYEEGVPPEFRVRFLDLPAGAGSSAAELCRQLRVRTVRPAEGNVEQVFLFEPVREVSPPVEQLALGMGGPLGLNASAVEVFHSTTAVPEPHSFTAVLSLDGESTSLLFEEEGEENEVEVAEVVSATNGPPKSRREVKAKKAQYEQDNNFRAALLHVTADAFVSVLTIVAIAIAGTVPGAWFLNPLVGIIGAGVIASWSLQLARATVSTLLDMAPDADLNHKLRSILQKDGDSSVVDLHVWKLGPGKLGAIFSVLSKTAGRTRNYYWNKVKRFSALAHVTIEVYHEAETQDHSHSHDHAL